MPSLNIADIKHDFPDINFEQGDDFSWSPSRQTITHPELHSAQDFCQLLHEIGHAKLKHKKYSRDIALIDMERSAWEYAVKLAPQYNINLAMTDDIVQDALDTYREWLHVRSVCPECGAVGLQSSTDRYSCIHCQSQWRVNEARTCQLRRYKQK